VEAVLAKAAALAEETVLAEEVKLAEEVVPAKEAALAADDELASDAVPATEAGLAVLTWPVAEPTLPLDWGAVFSMNAAMKSIPAMFTTATTPHSLRPRFSWSLENASVGLLKVPSGVNENLSGS
jgi:hypothetical protein